MAEHPRILVAWLALALLNGACAGQSAPATGVAATAAATERAAPTDPQTTGSPTTGGPPSASAGAAPGPTSASTGAPTAGPTATGTDLATPTARASPAVAPAPIAVPVHDTIAYVQGASADAIRLIDPDGGNDRALWAHGYDDENDVYDVWSIAWKPDATELAFASTHENWCSINASDVFAIAADGTDYRRVTQAPACADLASYPTGTVRIPLAAGFLGSSFTGFVYLQGAQGVQQVSLGPGGSSELILENVADFGPNTPQFAVLIEGTRRDFHLGTSVDVVAGATVRTAALRVTPPDEIWEPRTPTWRFDGSALGYAYGFNSLFGITPRPGAIDFGTSLVGDGADVPNIVLHMAWGPTSGTGDEILYQGTEAGVSEGIYLVPAGSATAGEELVTFPALETVKGLAWLPDGSGFVFSVTEGEFFPDTRSGNVFRYTLATRQVARVTQFRNEYAGLLSVSPDGKSVVFERAGDLDPLDGSLVGPDLWIVSLAGGSLRLLVQDARAPAWSP